MKIECTKLADAYRYTVTVNGAELVRLQPPADAGDAGRYAMRESELARTMIALMAKVRPPAETDAISALEYACEIEGNSRRGVWVRAYVEGEEWAIADLARWRADR